MTRVPWAVDLHDEFEREFNELPKAVQDELLAHIEVLETFGPQLGRPRVDTLNDSSHANMKELRFDAADGVWRFAFAFDPMRVGIVLCGGDKSGVSERRFYKQLIDKADSRFDAQLMKLRRASIHGRAKGKRRRRRS